MNYTEYLLTALQRISKRELGLLKHPEGTKRIIKEHLAHKIAEKIINTLPIEETSFNEEVEFKIRVFVIPKEKFFDFLESIRDPRWKRLKEELQQKINSMEQLSKNTDRKNEALEILLHSLFSLRIFMSRIDAEINES